MDKIIRCITSDGGIVATAIDSTDIVYKAQRVHASTPVTTAALGRLLSAASLMGIMLKSEDASITLRINGNGPAGSIIAVSDSNGNCRGYVANPDIDLPKNKYGKLDVAGAVGTDGQLNVMKDFGTGEPYIGSTAIVSGEIAEDITNYYAVSEQTPTVCALGVLVDKDSGKVLLSGGFIIQLLPGYDMEMIEHLEQNINELEPITTMLAKGMGIEEICRTALKGFEVEVLDTNEVAYKCNCTRERVENAVALLSEEEILTLGDEKGIAEVKCHFCDRVYRLNQTELDAIAARKK